MGEVLGWGPGGGGRGDAPQGGGGEGPLRARVGPVKRVLEGGWRPQDGRGELCHLLMRLC